METDPVIDQLLNFRNQFAVQFSDQEWKALTDNFRKEMLFRLKVAKEERAQQTRKLEYKLTTAESAIFRESYHLPKLLHDAFRVDETRLSDFIIHNDEKKGKTIEVAASVLDYLIAMAIQKYQKKREEGQPVKRTRMDLTDEEEEEEGGARPLKELVEEFVKKCFINRKKARTWKAGDLTKIGYVRSHNVFAFFLTWMYHHDIKCATKATLEEFNSILSWIVGDLMVKIPGPMDTYAIGGYVVDISEPGFAFPRLPAPVGANNASLREE